MYKYIYICSIIHHKQQIMVDFPMITMLNDFRNAVDKIQQQQRWYLGFSSFFWSFGLNRPQIHQISSYGPWLTTQVYQVLNNRRKTSWSY